MEIVHTIEEIQQVKQDQVMVALYFSGESCNVCNVLRTKVSGILSNFPEIRSIEVSAEEHMDIAAAYQVFSIPLLILFIEGKEYIRVGRNVNMSDLEQEIKRYYEMVFS